MKIRAVLFDLDGTLVDSAQDFIAILQQMRQERDMPTMDAKLIRQQASAGAAAMVSTALELAQEHIEFTTYKNIFLQRYQENCARYTRPFTGLSELLSYLDQHRIPWGVATNKPVQFAEPILQQLGLLERMAVLVCPEHVHQAKPAPEMLLLACQKLDIAPNQAIYLGDDLRDIQSANAAGMPSVAVGYGYHNQADNPQNWGADYFIAQSEQLLTELKPLLFINERVVNV